MAFKDWTWRSPRLTAYPVALVLSAVVLALGVGTSCRLARLSHDGAVTAARAAVSAQLDRVRGDLSRELFAGINLSEGLITLVRLRAGIQQDEFDALAAAIIRRSSVIRNVALAPGTVIRFMYPIQGNEAAIGVDYLQTPNQRDMVVRAIAERRTVVAGPLQLVQGGTGIIGRTPIFKYARPGVPADDGEYWGIAATVISFDRLLAASGMDEARRTLRIALRGRDGTGAQGPPFWGDQGVFDQHPVQMDVPLPSGSWAIAGAPIGGWPVFTAWRSFEFVAGCGFSLLLAALLFQVLQVSHERRLDVLARQKTEVELRQANRALLIKGFAIESATSGMALIDLDGRVSYANPALAAMIGRSRDELMGITLEGLLGPAAAATIEQGLADRGVWRGEVVAAVGPETVRDLDGEAGTVRRETGEAVCRSLSFQDVTERKRMMAEVERSQRLSALSLFAGGVAHDFNNLLAGLFGNIELARLALPANSPALPHLDTSAAAFERARDLTQRLLTFAIGSPPQRRRVSLVAFLRECCSLSLSGSNCQWIVAPAGGAAVWDVLADANQLSQVFTNILVNARQAMPDGGHADLTVRNLQVAPGTAGDLDAGRYVEVAVTDDGHGIPPEILPRVFDPFFTTKPGGSGLGLAMSYSIVRAHGGRVTASSAPGAGTTMRVWLPAAPAEAAQADQPSREASAGEARGGRLLLMDDERMVRQMTSRMLTHGGYEVVAVCDGAEAVERCREALAAGTPFDAAILDVTVPGGVGGKEAMRRLRDLQPDLPVVLSSGYGDAAGTGGDCRPTATLPKPYQMHELLACIRAVVK